MSLLLDTTVLVDLERSQAPALRWLERQSRVALYASAVSVFELHVGADRPDAAQRIAQVLGSISVVGVDSDIAARAGALFRQYEARGMGRLDALIGATAIVTRLPLVTSNVKHFPGVKGVRKPY